MTLPPEGGTTQVDAVGCLFILYSFVARPEVGQFVRGSTPARGQLPSIGQISWRLTDPCTSSITARSAKSRCTCRQTYPHRIPLGLVECSATSAARRGSLRKCLARADSSARPYLAREPN